MSLFSSDQDLYDCVGPLFHAALADPDLVAKLTKADMVLQYDVTNPQARITLRLQSGEAGNVDLGATELRPDVVMTMSSDTLHRFFLGKVNPTIALAKGDIKARGPVAKVLRLVPAVRPMFKMYRSQLDAAGRTDLIDA